MGNKIQTYLGMRAVKPLTTNGQPASGEDFFPSLPNDIHEQAFETPKGLLSIWKTTVSWDFSGHLNMLFLSSWSFEGKSYPEKGSIASQREILKVNLSGSQLKNSCFIGFVTTY